MAHIQQWTEYAPWPSLQQVEQDLIISRAICDLFRSEYLKDTIAFRGGTAINKLLFSKPLRYSEDIDLVQTRAEPIKKTVGEIRRVLGWLGKCNYDATTHSVHLEFKFIPEADANSQLKLKVEINTREHEAALTRKTYRFAVNSDWHQSNTEIVSFEPDELFGTKLRALLQRNKNRDMFDLNEGLVQLNLDRDRVVKCFQHYLALEAHPISRANAEERMLMKLNRSLTEDIIPLLPAGLVFDDQTAIVAFGRVWGELIASIPGEPWKASRSVIESIRQSKIPSLLDGIYE